MAEPDYLRAVGAVGTLGDWSLADPPTFRFGTFGDEYFFKSETWVPLSIRLRLFWEIAFPLCQKPVCPPKTCSEWEVTDGFGKNV